MHILTIIAAAAAAAVAAVGPVAGASLSWPTTSSWQNNPLRRPLQQCTRTNTVIEQVYLCHTHHHRSTMCVTAVGAAAATAGAAAVNADPDAPDPPSWITTRLALRW